MQDVVAGFGSVVKLAGEQASRQDVALAVANMREVGELAVCIMRLLNTGIAKTDSQAVALWLERYGVSTARCNNGVILLSV